MIISRILLPRIDLPRGCRRLRIFFCCLLSLACLFYQGLSQAKQLTRLAQETRSQEHLAIADCAIEDPLVIIYTD